MVWAASGDMDAVTPREMRRTDSRTCFIPPTTLPRVVLRFFRVLTQGWERASRVPTAAQRMSLYDKYLATGTARQQPQYARLRLPTRNRNGNHAGAVRRPLLATSW